MLQVSGWMLQDSGCKFQVAGCRFQLSGFGFQVSKCRLQVRVVDFGQFRLQPILFGFFDHPKCEDEKKKNGKRKETTRAQQSI